MEIPFISLFNNTIGDVDLYTIETFNIKKESNLNHSFTKFIESNKSKYFSKEEIDLIKELINSEDRDNYLIAYTIINERKEEN